MNQRDFTMPDTARILGTKLQPRPMGHTYSRWSIRTDSTARSTESDFSRQIKSRN